MLAQNLNPVIQISKRFKLIGSFYPNMLFEGDAAKLQFFDTIFAMVIEKLHLLLKLVFFRIAKKKIVEIMKRILGHNRKRK